MRPSKNSKTKFLKSKRLSKKSKRDFLKRRSKMTHKNNKRGILKSKTVTETF